MEKTTEWIHTEIGYFKFTLKMRPIDDTTSQEELFEKWLEETYEDTKWGQKTPIEFVFSSHKPTIEIFKRRGVFVFDCNQEKE